MKKMTLQVDSLAVQSFPTGETDGQIGTAEAREMLATRPGVCDPFTLPPRCA
jgi:hypothetical protein